LLNFILFLHNKKTQSATRLCQFETTATPKISTAMAEMVDLDGSMWTQHSDSFCAALLANLEAMNNKQLKHFIRRDHPSIILAAARLYYDDPIDPSASAVCQWESATDTGAATATGSGTLGPAAIAKAIILNALHASDTQAASGTNDSLRLRLESLEFDQAVREFEHQQQHRDHAVTFSGQTVTKTDLKQAANNWQSDTGPYTGRPSGSSGGTHSGSGWQAASGSASLPVASATTTTTAAALRVAFKLRVKHLANDWRGVHYIEEHEPGLSCLGLSSGLRLSTHNDPGPGPFLPPKWNMDTTFIMAMNKGSQTTRILKQQKQLRLSQSWPCSWPVATTTEYCM
jgi:hypothetical protein